MSKPDGIWTLIVHGGAREIETADRPASAEGCRQAAEIGGQVLAAGGRALDAVEAAVRLLEDLPQYNAGTGSVRNCDGDVEMDAAIMDGRTLDVGGVGAIRGVRHPISVAKALLDETPVLLVGDGARRFAERIGAQTMEDDASIAPSGMRGCDTVGCIARDQHGNVAAAGSTGGLEGKMAGRVGDTPMPGCGLYADDLLGAAALSGDGESIARAMLAARALNGLKGEGSLTAAQTAMKQIARTGGEAGIILLHPDGGFAVAHNSPQFAIGISAHFLDGAQAGTHSDELKGLYS